MEPLELFPFLSDIKSDLDYFYSLIISQKNISLIAEPKLDQIIAKRPNLESNIKQLNKLEEQSSFTSLSPRAPENFSENLQNIYKKRTENLTAGRMINHGMPFSEEERDD